MSMEKERLPAAGDRISRYEVVAQVGQGGMAAVYAVRLRGIGGFGKILAMKVLLPHLKSRELVDMFLDEARIAAQIQHPNVAQLFELGEHEGTPFMVMELLRGRSYAGVIDRARERQIELPRALHLRVLADAARGLHAAHEARDEEGKPLAVVHRDVSPQNIHVGYDGHVKVVDFGIARARGRITQTESGTVKGKLRYLAPEQLDRSSPMDRRIDVWALGVILWEVFTHELLFRADDEATTIYNVLNKEVPRLSSRVADVPPEIDALCAACLSRDGTKRPENAEVVARALDTAARAMGGDESMLREHLATLFAEERDRSELQLSRAVQELESRAQVVSTPTLGGAPKKSRVWIAAVVALPIVAAAGYAGWRLVPTDPPPERAATAIAAPPAVLRPAQDERAPAPEPEAAAPEPVEPVAEPEPAARPRRRTRRQEPASIASTPTETEPGRRPLLGNPY
jgi:serine/threonine protein kinase